MRRLPPGGRYPDQLSLVRNADGAVRYQCPICGKLVSWSNRSHHKAIHRGLTTCRACGTVFCTRKLLRTHHCTAAAAAAAAGGMQQGPAVSQPQLQLMLQMPALPQQLESRPADNGTGPLF